MHIQTTKILQSREITALHFSLVILPLDHSSYDKFSNTVNESRRKLDFENLGSLEGIHGEIHGILVCLFALRFEPLLIHITQGGNGHMVGGLNTCPRLD